MDPADLVTYEEFGRRFFEVAVTEQRVGDAIGAIAGEAFEMGLIAQGPGRLAKVTAKVRIMAPRVTRDLGEAITFSIRIPLEIDMVVDLRIDKPKFMVFGEIALRVIRAAREMGMDPAELRRKNFIQPEQFPYATPVAVEYDTGNYDATLDKALEMSDYAGFDARLAESKARGKLRGIFEDGHMTLALEAENQFEAGSIFKPLVDPRRYASALVELGLVCDLIDGFLTRDWVKGRL